MQTIDRIIALVHPAFSYDDSVAEQGEHRARAYHEELYAKWIERAQQLSSNEVMIAFLTDTTNYWVSHKNMRQDIEDERYYIQKARELKEAGGRRLFVVGDALDMTHNERVEVGTERFRILQNLMEARGFTFDPRNVTLEVCGMALGVCVENVAEYMREAGQITEESIIRVSLTSEPDTDDKGIEALNEAAKHKRLPFRYLR